MYGIQLVWENELHFVTYKINKRPSQDKRINIDLSALKKERKYILPLDPFRSVSVLSSSSLKRGLVYDEITIIRR